MLRIGDFSRIARVSTRLLRYYDEFGLLRPARIDAGSGYRWYRVAQLQELNRILVLKELGLSLEEIAGVVAKGVTAVRLREMLLARRGRLERELAEESARLRHIETRIAQIDAEGALSVDDVVMRAEPARTIASLRQVVPSFAAARELIGQATRAVRASLPVESIGPLIALAHAPEFDSEQLDVEMGYVLKAPPAAGRSLAPLAVRELPAVERMAACVRVGLPEHAHLVTAKIGAFLEANGYQLAGPSREVFLEPPRPERMEEAVVEMQYPVERAG
jgi:DNA-binding transcriptional MerR regulator